MGLRRLFVGRGSSSPGVELIVGGIYSIIKSRESGDFGVVKLLVLDERAVHIRSYANRYAERPATVDASTLTLGSGTPLIRHPDGSITLPRPEGPMGIGHLPISRAQFLDWRPQLMMTQPVSEHELEGYREWENAGGGVWG